MKAKLISDTVAAPTTPTKSGKKKQPRTPKKKFFYAVAKRKGSRRL